MSVIENILKAKEMATLPDVANRVLKMLESDDIDLRNISKVIEADPALTIKLLRVANSPLYAAKAEIRSIQQAIMIMGFSKLTNIVLGVSIFSKFWLGQKKEAANIMNKFWWHSSSAGTIAKSITAKMKKNYRENEFVGGLLHKIGKLALLQYDVTKFNQTISLITEKNISDVDAEKQVFGVDHIEVGDQIAKSWKLPDDIRAIIANYPHPSKLTNHKELVAAVSFAGLLCEINGADFYKGLVPEDITDDESWEILIDSVD